MSSRREQARSLAEAIDCALLRSAPAALQRALELSRPDAASRVADRVQLRAKRLAGTHATQRSHILVAADALILALYRSAVPATWLCAWCDATVTRDGSPRYAGVGAVILNGHGRECARSSCIACRGVTTGLRIGSPARRWRGSRRLARRDATRSA